MKLAASLLVLLVASGLASADSCTTTEPTLTLVTPAGTFYVQNDMCQPDCLFSIWVYQESNGVEGLQRGDETCDDDCCGAYEADTILF